MPDSPDHTERRIVVRPTQVEDIDAIRDLAVRCFPGMQPWLREQLESQLTVFPEGQLCVELDGVIVASSSNLIVDFDDYEEWQNWKVISDSGYIRNHNPNGDTLYGIEIMVDPSCRGMKLARRL